MAGRARADGRLDHQRSLSAALPPLFGNASGAYRRPVGEYWQVDETGCRVCGRRICVYGAIDQEGQVVDAFVSTRRNAMVAGDTNEAVRQATLNARPGSQPVSHDVEFQPYDPPRGWELNALVRRESRGPELRGHRDRRA